MKELTDKELDELFKTAAEGVSPTYDQASWEGMASKLDSKPPSLFQRGMPALVIGGIMFLSGLWIGKNLDEDVLPANVQTPQNTTKNSQWVQPSEPVDDRSNLSYQTINLESQATDKEVTFASPDSENNQQQILVESDTESLLSLINTESDLQPIEQNAIEAELLQSDSIPEIKVIKDSTVLSKEPDDKQEGKKGHKLFIRFLASPDLSAIEFGPAQLGSNVGIMGEFSFTERLSVSSGVIRSVKNYESNQQDAYGYSSRNLIGSCHILDVPINVSYYFPFKKKISAYLSGGVSSYLMLSEDYEYTVKTSTGEQVYPYQVENENNEWFKVLNLSAGVQYQLGQRWHVQVEPFLKAPMADLGELNVKLSSYGVFGALRFQLNSIHKK